MLWEDLCALLLEINGRESDGKSVKRLAGKAEGLAWSISRIISPYEDSPGPVKTLEVVRDIAGNWLEAHEARRSTIDIVPWKDPRIAQPRGPVRVIPRPEPTARKDN